MKANKVVDFFSHLVNKLEPEFTLRLKSVEYSPKHGHEICVMQLVGKNAFPKFTPEELLSNPKAMVGLSPNDAVVITRLDSHIKERKKKCRILEVDKNGTVVLKDSSGNIKRYSEKYISSDRNLLSTMGSMDAHDLGYRVGYRDGLETKEFKKEVIKRFKNKVKKLIPNLRLINKQ